MTNNKILNRIYDVTPLDQMDEVAQSELAEVLRFEHEDEETTEQINAIVNDEVNGDMKNGGFQLC